MGQPRKKSATKSGTVGVGSFLDFPTFCMLISVYHTVHLLIMRFLCNRAIPIGFDFHQVQYLKIVCNVVRIPSCGLRNVVMWIPSCGFHDVDSVIWIP